MAAFYYLRHIGSSRSALFVLMAVVKYFAKKNLQYVVLLLKLV